MIWIHVAASEYKDWIPPPPNIIVVFKCDVPKSDYSSERVTIFLFHVSLQGRITAWSGLEGTSVGHPVQPPAQAGSPRAGCTGPCPGGFWISPEKETPQPPWAAWARAPSPSEGRSSSSCSAGTSSASEGDCFLWSGLCGPRHSTSAGWCG